MDCPGTASGPRYFDSLRDRVSPLGGSLTKACDTFKRLMLHIPRSDRRSRRLELIQKSGAYVIVEKRAGFRKDDNRPLNYLLHDERFGGFECSNLLDKVYGLLGISSWREHITVDYTKTLDQVCLEVLECLPEHRDVLVDLMNGTFRAHFAQGPRSQRR